MRNVGTYFENENNVESFRILKDNMIINMRYLLQFDLFYQSYKLQAYSVNSFRGKGLRPFVCLCYNRTISINEKLIYLFVFSISLTTSK